MNGAKSSSLRAIWAWPLAIALLSALGLLSALLGDGAWDVLSWIGLGAPVLAGCALGLRRRGGTIGR
jgi:hypothetical protein